MQTHMHRHRFPTAYGDCAVTRDQRGLLGFTLPGGDLPDPAAILLPVWLLPLVDGVQRHLGGELQAFGDAPYVFSAVTDFERRVYVAALGISPGVTQSYGELAAALGLPAGSARAVAARPRSQPVAFVGAVSPDRRCRWLHDRLLRSRRHSHQNPSPCS